MKVILYHNAFLDGTHYKRSPYPQELPESVRAILPKGSKIVDKPVPLPPKEEQKAVLRDFDELRPASDKEQAIRNKTK